MGLTTKRIARLRKRPGRYHDGHGLYLQVLSPNSASWILRYVRQGKERMLGLGPLRLVGLKEVRIRAREEQRKLKLDGIDPVEDRKAKKAAHILATAKSMTFKECAEAYIALNRGAWKNAKHGAQWSATLKTYVYPHIGNLPVADIDTGLVLKCIEPIWHEKTESASRVRGRIESILDWATVRNLRKGDNPARWTGHLEHTLPAKGKIAKVEHHAALPYRELPAFMQELRPREGSAARVLEFTILTAARTGEVIGAQWSEIDFDTKTWTVPAGRMKGSREHRVPLSERALEVLHGLHREDGNDYVFIGAQRGGGLSSMSMNAVLNRMDRNDITVHGFRSTFRDWAAERTNFANHVVGDGACPRHWRQGRGQLSPWQPVRQAPPVDGSVGALLQPTHTRRRGGATATSRWLRSAGARGPS
jgi:integrase